MKHLSIILLLFMFGCISKDENPQQSSIAEQTDSIQYADTLPLFKIKAIEDTLYSFMNLTDTIYNPLNAPKINIIHCSLSDKKDTLINFSMYVTLPYFDPEYYNVSLEGACKIRGEYVVVYKSELESLASILNEDCLSMDYLKDKDRIVDYSSLIDYIWDYFPSDWTYKLSGDSLIEVRRHTYIQPYQRRGLSFK